MPPIVPSLTPVTRTCGAVWRQYQEAQIPRDSDDGSDNDEVWTMSGDVGVDVIPALVADQSYLNSIRVLMRGW